MKSVMDQYESVFNKYALQRPIKRMVDERISQGKPLWNESDGLTDVLSQYGATRGDVERYAGGRAIGKELGQAQNLDLQKHQFNNFFSALPTGQTPLQSKFMNPSGAIGVQFQNSPDTVSAPGSFAQKVMNKIGPLQDYARQAPEAAAPDIAERLRAFKAAKKVNPVVEAGQSLLSRAGMWAVNNPIKSLGIAGAATLGGRALLGKDEEPSQYQQVMPAYSASPYDFAYNKMGSWQGYAKSMGAGAAAGGVGGYLMGDPGNKGQGLLGGAALGGAAGGGIKFLSNSRARQGAAGALGDLKKNFDAEQTGYYDMMANKVNMREGAREAMRGMAQPTPELLQTAQRADHDVRGLHQMASMSEQGYRHDQGDINQKLRARLGRIF